MKIIKKLLTPIKIISICFLCYYLFLNLSGLFLFSKEKRFKIAEKNQGSYLSQTLFDILIFQYPDYSDAYFEKSVAFNKRGEYAKGFELLNKAVEINPELHLGYRGWLRLHKLKDYKGCIEDLNRLDSLTPNFVDSPWSENIHYLLGLSYKGLKKYDLSMKEFDKSINSQKDSSWVNHNLFLYKGIILKEQEKYSYALKNFDACLRYNYGKSSEAYYQKGLVFKELNQLDSAQSNFKKSLKLFNENYTNKDVYNEVQDELYFSDITKELEYFGK